MPVGETDHTTGDDVLTSQAEGNKVLLPRDVLPYDPQLLQTIFWMDLSVKKKVCYMVNFGPLFSDDEPGITEELNVWQGTGLEDKEPAPTHGWNVCLTEDTVVSVLYADIDERSVVELHQTSWRKSVDGTYDIVPHHSIFVNNVTDNSKEWVVTAGEPHLGDMNTFFSLMALKDRTKIDAVSQMIGDIYDRSGVGTLRRITHSVTDEGDFLTLGPYDSNEVENREEEKEDL